jgi:proline dehydrogenase
MISFENTEIAFKGKSDKDLKRARWLFKLVGSSGMVRFGKWMTNFALKAHLPVKGLIKRTIFHQFCGGVSISDSIKTSDELASRNVKTILDFSVEGKTSEDDLDNTLNEILATIEEAENNPNIPFAVFKTTGISTFEILEKANASVSDLNEEELKSFERIVERVDTICSLAKNANVPVFIDAEESWIQDSIDRIVTEMSEKYNRDKAIVYNTLQMYRHDRVEFLNNAIAEAKNKGYFLGMKIVRGAYMEKERERAIEKGYPSPIQPDKSSSDRDFNEALRISIQNIDCVSICAGTHNEESSLLLTELMKESNISNEDPRVYFAQLLGMSDHISFNLADKGYMVAKYVPYGPIKEVMPYLIRRAEENTSVAGQTSRELSLIIKEIKRRKEKA